LTPEELDRLINKNDGITTVCFMGGDANPREISDLAHMIKSEYKKLKVGWYTGRDDISKEVNWDWFDYFKVGHYDEDLGGLNKKTTNQRLYHVNRINIGDYINYKLDDITYLFWK
jgi:anaerobic ribonucleoside-triphosphate reductase activating protein